MCLLIGQSSRTIALKLQRSTNLKWRLWKGKTADCDAMGEAGLSRRGCLRPAERAEAPGRSRQPSASAEKHGVSARHGWQPHRQTRLGKKRQGPLALALGISAKTKRLRQSPLSNGGFISCSTWPKRNHSNRANTFWEQNSSSGSSSLLSCHSSLARLPLSLESVLF